MSTSKENNREKRWVVEDFIGRQECAELIFLHRSNAVVGYRERFSVATLREPLAFGNWGHLLPLIRIRGIPFLLKMAKKRKNNLVFRHVKGCGGGAHRRASIVVRGVDRPVVLARTLLHSRALRQVGRRQMHWTFICFFMAIGVTRALVR
jgi:hypothetical protein